MSKSRIWDCGFIFVLDLSHLLPEVWSCVLLGKWTLLIKFYFASLETPSARPLRLLLAARVVSGKLSALSRWSDRRTILRGTSWCVLARTR